ncbi:hypothetical protein H7J87_07735 [Mycolicibacterium wolinskyi]|uniref:Lipoprotein n=1 Tax=Mycolicibacterium wolinskyi TaxID=59750 RepID=A0A1X2EZR1_9MYCO|nr:MULTISPECIES: hypothetical protein [Mycolicibacterium]MCV7285217.1 hypothetical protein [Mycolicibacterium wolinskyi]MCV7292341.1 hypothetical protein [Mycolicibacterium goodii]ORX11239.1 hypothetical protein AWC31_03760 [Mycolicibacterium wolinskyi]
MQRLMVAGLAAAAIGLAGCSNVTAGTPMADPDQTGISTTTTTKRTPTRTASPSTPLLPPPSPGGGGPSGASTPPPNGMSTTCTEYASLDEATQRGMVDLLSENGYPGMKKNPFIWVSFIGAMCALSDRDATVVEAINKKVPG